MAFSTRTIRIVGASLVAVLFVAAGYFFSGPLPFSKTEVASAEDTQGILKAYAAKDSDSDGLPDWEESLYGTDPANAHSVQAGMTDGAAVQQGLVKPKFESAAIPSDDTDAADVPGIDAASGTVTDQFARSLFSQYLQQRGSTPPSADDIVAFTQSAIDDLEKNHTVPDAFTMSDVRVSGSGPAAVQAYASAAEAAFAAHTIATDRSEISYYADAVEKSDAPSLKKVQEIGAAYTAMANAFVQVPVPAEAAASHLAIANSLARLGSTITDMGTINTDPLRAMLGISAYEDAANGLVTSFAGMNAVFANDGVEFQSGDSGYDFYSTAQMSAQ